MKILLVEDDVNVASLVRRGLAEDGYEVSVAMDGLTGLRMGLENQFDMAILDIMLPGMSGIEICAHWRKANITSPVLILTALGSTENIVTGLDSGADDYMVKPFKLAELQARIRSLSRRGKDKATADVLSLADLEVNLDSKIVSRQGRHIALTATEYRLLIYLLKNKRKVLSRMEILEHVWNVDFNMGTNVVDVYVNYLRKKIDKDFSPKLLHTVIGMGYILKEDYSDEDSK